MPRIMIADDDVTIQMELEEYLSHLGHTVVGTVDTGEEAIELAREMKSDLILMDVHLPVEIDGIAAAQKIKEEMDVAVVFVTGFGDPEYIERAKRVEPFGYVIKPFDEREINGVIEIALHKKALESELARVHKQLKESEERFRTIYEQSPIGIEIYNPEGKLQHVNNACLEMFGISNVSDVMGFGLFEDPNIPDDKRERLRKGENVRFEVAFDFEKVKAQKLYETKRSGTVCLDVQITPLGLSEEDSMTGYLVQVMDITGHKQVTSGNP